MTNIERTISIDLEGRFGKPSRKRYLYFSEATLFRVWVKDESLRAPIQAYLDGLDELEGLDEEERKELGLTSREFGDLIYHTPIGVQIVPSFWGPKPSVGMHGHHPKYPEQHGICLSTEPSVFEESVSAKEFHRVLSGYQEA
jgi:hypothetical protein